MSGVITFNDTSVKIARGIYDHTDSAGQAGQVLVSNGSGSSVSWADQTDTTYTEGTGVTIDGNEINIGQSVGTTDNVTFNTISLNNLFLSNNHKTYGTNVAFMAYKSVYDGADHSHAFSCTSWGGSLINSVGSTGLVAITHDNVYNHFFHGNGNVSFGIDDSTYRLYVNGTTNLHGQTTIDKKLTLSSDTYGATTGSRIKFSMLDHDQSVRIRHNIFDSSSPAGTNTPFGLIIEKDGSNTQSGNAYLQVEGRIYTGSTHLTSDDRIKSYETEISNATEIIKTLRPLKYEKHPSLILDEEHENPDLTNVDHYTEVGFIAQELEKIKELSFMVMNDPSKELKTVGMLNLIGYIVKGFQELEVRVSALENK